MSKVTKSGHLTLNNKHDILTDLAAKIDRNVICKKYAIANSTISKIIKKKSSIEERLQHQSGDVKHNRSSSYPLLDKALLEWFYEQRARNVPLNGPLLLEKANQLAAELNIKLKKEEVSQGFLSKFKKRHNIQFRVISGVAASVDTGRINDFSARDSEALGTTDAEQSSDWAINDTFENVSSRPDDMLGDTSFEKKVTVTPSASRIKRSRIAAGSDGIDLQYKVTMLEETLKKFRAEVDMKMSIVEQVLTTRNELFSIHKKLIDREQVLHETVLDHWKNISDMAERGLSLKFSVNTSDVGDFEAIIDSDNEDNSVQRKRQASRSTLARRSRRKRQKTEYRYADSDSGSERSDDDPGQDGSSFQAESEQHDVDVHDDNGDDNDNKEGTSSDGLERKVFVKYYSEEDPKPGQKVTRTPVWRHFLRSETGDSALCEICDQAGVQSIVSVVGGSTSTLHRHLKCRHKIIVGSSNAQDPKKPTETE